VTVSGSYSVSVSDLSAGVGTVNGLGNESQSKAAATLQSIASLQDAVGDPGLAGALDKLGSAAAQSAAVLISVLAQVANTLGKNASSYQDTEDKNTKTIRGAR
jgi:hypothetical protein